MERRGIAPALGPGAVFDLADNTPARSRRPLAELGWYRRQPEAKPVPYDPEDETQAASEPAGLTPAAGAIGPLPDGASLGHYRVLAHLGSGGMGHIHRALDERLEREVALKVAGRVDPGASRALHEARALAALNHPNVVTVYELGAHQGRPYIVMELLRGESLRERLARGPLSTADALRVGCDVARGLAAAHAVGVLHLDLKPENLFLTDEGAVKLLDFGVSRAARAVTSGDPETGLAGTVSYMAPEQLEGAAVDHRADLYALGLVLYELATGRQPFKGVRRVEAMRAGRAAEPSLAPGVMDPILEALVRGCLSRDPASRPASAAEVLERLEGLRRASRSDPLAGASATPSGDVDLGLSELAPLADKAFTVRVTAGATLVFEGVMAPRDPEAMVFPHFERVHGRVAGCGALTLDVRALKQVNSATLGLFIRWLGWIRAEPESRRYRLEFIADPAVLWQRANLKPLEMIAPETLRVTMRPAGR